MKLSLNVGCGERTYAEYPPGYTCLNFDERADLPNVDVAGDVRNLAIFPDGHFDYILASDIIEHFPIAETPKILAEWRRVLKVGGTIEFRLPDLKAICSRYAQGKATAKLTSWLLYGGQTYPGNFHYVGFDRVWLAQVLRENGFDPFEATDADNNFEMKARKI
ncbi:MAG: hypothetical protein DRI65_07510 [Chloroflexota bacterium]|nr:MAG: hypothetical protein DRI65_07510 [Chloroflexota bacterium]